MDGVLVLGPDGSRLVVAGAAGDAVTGAIGGALGGAFAAQGQKLAVETVHPFAAGDAHGLILFFLVVAVIVSTVVAQAVILATAATTPPALRLATVVAYALLAGLVGTATTALIVGGYGDGFWAVAGLTALASVAVGAPIAALARLLGPPGFALGALVMVLFDLVFYRAVAPWMPASEVYSALRGALYFDGAGVAAPVLLLSAWVLAGLLVAVLAGLVRPQRAARAAAPAV